MWQFLNSMTMYRLMLYFMLALLAIAAGLSATGILPYDAVGILLQALVFAAVCRVFNALIARGLKVKPNVESSLISGLILAAIVGPLALPQEWLVIVGMSGFAMASKYLLAPKHSHLFNPAAFGAVAGALVLGYPASWWIGSSALLPFILIGGWLIMQKIKRWHLVASFLGTYLGLLVLDGWLLQGRGVAETWSLLQGLILSSPLLFFSFVMLVEPLTAPQTMRRRVAFGVVIGALLFGLQRFVPSIPYSLELSLLIGNIFSRLISPDFRQAFVLRQRELINATLGHFWFEPTRRFAYLPGQFLEYTIAHPKADGRGVRRYFTIASAPTEKEVLLTTKFSEPGSTFKQALAQLKAGEEVMASKVAGEFVLPKDSEQKLAFIAGGIGVTPFRSMVKYLLDTGERRDIVLLYAVRQEKDIVFRDIFEEAERKFGLRMVYVIAEEGRMVEADLIQKEVQDWRERVWYVSGPEPMVESLSKVLAGLKIPRTHIKRDYFPGYTQ